jgi:lipopolysaccharide biosynthesis regulator YciM
MKKPQWIALALTGVVVVLIILAPNHSGKFNDAEMQAENTPPDLEYKIDSALSIIASEAPMQGILLLRSVAEEDPSNFRAQYHLGRFSAQTGHWEKVIERFEMVKKIDPEFVETEYWMGLANFNLGKTEQAKSYLESYISKEKENSQLINDAETMLNQFK